jgi:hypothetical protein
MMARWREAAADNAVPLILTVIAFGGSFTHWVHLASTHGQRGLLAPAVAVCVDLGAYMAARERQRDMRLSRERRGWTSWPTLVMAATIGLTLAGNVASAQRGPWGIVTALIPGGFLLIAISLMERRAAEDGRRQLAAERERQAEAAAERQRQAEAEAAERERQSELAAERERQDAAARRQADLVARRAQFVTPPSAIVTPGPVRLALAAAAGPAAGPPAGTGGGQPSAVSATAVMRAYWDTEIAAGRVPSGADLVRAAGLSPSSSLGRQLRARWLPEVPGQAGAGELDGARA